MKKTRSKKSRDTVPLNMIILYYCTIVPLHRFSRKIAEEYVIYIESKAFSFWRPNKVTQLNSAAIVCFSERKLNEYNYPLSHLLETTCIPVFSLRANVIPVIYETPPSPIPLSHYVKKKIVPVSYTYIRTRRGA
jgi:hypothetical protein